MSRLLLVARHEYLRHARRRGFLLATFGLPLLALGALALLVFVLTNTFQPERALGYVDPAGLVAADVLPADGDEPGVPLRAFPDEAAARAALDAGDIDVYAVIPADYVATGTVTIHGPEELSAAGRRSLQAALDRGVLLRSDAPPDRVARALDPLGAIEQRTPDGAVVDDGLLAGRIVSAILGSLLFAVTVFSSASYLLQALVEEKENRTMEIVTTSISPDQLIGGKTLGLGLLGLTIALAWLLAVALAWVIGASLFAPLRTVTLPPAALAAGALLLPLGFLLFAGLMVLISAVVPTAQEGQQFAGVINLLAVLPLMASVVFFTAPNGALATALSLFPLSAPVAMQLRLALGAVPLWQLGLSITLLAGAAALVVWAAARVFRAGMLRYGKRLGLRDALRALRAG